MMEGEASRWACDLGPPRGLLLLAAAVGLGGVGAVGGWGWMRKAQAPICLVGVWWVFGGGCVVSQGMGVSGLKLPPVRMYTN